MSDFSYRLTRTLDAPIAAVWQAWTDDKQYEQWSQSAPGSVHQDVRPGGAWTAGVVDPEGNTFEINGTYLEVEPERLLVMDMPTPTGTTVMKLELTDKGDRTEIVLSQECDSAEERDMAEQGSTMLLDWVTAFLADRA
ncbi:SRPBCC domain-containing protein [Nocardia sp. NPDC051832]|uniref:SRPBCC family protein n=1 Tax=Nocardia sp. NPDC051832 TaxID=3155673 RepID=UPI003447037F